MSDDPWESLIEPIAKRYALAAELGYSFVHTAPGCHAMAAILRDMAAKLDSVIAQAGEPPDYGYSSADATMDTETKDE